MAIVLSRRGGRNALLSLGDEDGPGATILMRPSAGVGGGGGGDLLSLSEQGQAQLMGDITLSAGTGITLTQTGNNIEIASS